MKLLYHNMSIEEPAGRADTTGAPRDLLLLVLALPEAGALGAAVVMAVACFSGAKLGPAAVKLGAQRFVGFRDSLFWYPQSKRCEEALGLVVADLVRVILQFGTGVTLAQLVAPARSRERYFRDMSSRGDGEAGSVAGALAILSKSLTLN